MIGWLIYRSVDVKKNKGYIDLYFEEGKDLGIEIKLILVDRLSFGVKNNVLFLEYNGQSIEKPDFAINRSIYPLLTKHLEDMGIKVFNNSELAEMCNDKAKTYQYISRLKIPMVDSQFVKAEYQREVIENLTDKMVIKGVSGHGGNEVFLYNPVKKIDVFTESTYWNDQEIKKEEVLTTLKHTDIVIQPLVGIKNQDLRIYVIGKKIIAAILRTGKNSFKSNFSLGGQVREYKLSQKETELVNIIINEFDFGLVGIDFLIDDNNNFLFNEIEDVVGARMLYQCTDINIVRLYLEYIKQ